MPDPNEFYDEAEWMKVCVPKMIDEGNDQEQAVAVCTSMWADKGDAAKYRALTCAVKAVGNWELDITATPFNSRDSDGQWFDNKTDIMESAFTTPVLLYQHGIKQGAKGLQDHPIVIGRTVPGSLIKQSDGWHLRGILDQAKENAKDIMDAAIKRKVAVSSDSILHLARLEVGGKYIQYEKNKPGRIAVWPLAGVSLWEKGGGNFQPANQLAMALPAMKAIYRVAGLPFPDVIDTHGVTNGVTVHRTARTEMRAEIEKVKQEARQILRYIEN